MKTKKISQRTKGKRHGPIIRVVSPGDFGQVLKPFVFLDHLDVKLDGNFGFDFHPHSGIATLTYQLNVDVQYVDTEMHEGILKARGLEWMQAGGGAWHKGTILAKGNVAGFQLWIALPPEVESAKSFSIYVPPSDIPELDGVRVLLGEYLGSKSPLNTPHSMNYFDISLKQDETKTIEIPKNHEVCWVYGYLGNLETDAQSFSRELIVFGAEGDQVEIKAVGGPGSFILGSAVKHDFPLVTGYSSVHTNKRALEEGEKRIEELEQHWRGMGKIK